MKDVIVVRALFQMFAKLRESRRTEQIDVGRQVVSLLTNSTSDRAMER